MKPTSFSSEVEKSNAAKLAANDFIEIYTAADVSLTLKVGAATNTRFSGFLVSAT